MGSILRDLDRSAGPPPHTNGSLGYLSARAAQTIRALASRARNTEVGVAKLEWEPQGSKFVAQKHSPLEYTIEKGEVHFRLYLGRTYWHLGTFDTLEATQDQAQADFDQRIRSALSSPPSPAEVTVTDEMREAHYREFMADKGHGPDGRTTRQALADALDAALAALNGKE